MLRQFLQRKTAFKPPPTMQASTHQLRRAKFAFSEIFRSMGRLIWYLAYGTTGTTLSYRLRRCAHILYNASREISQQLDTYEIEHGLPDTGKVKELRDRALVAHTSLPHNDCFSYSILIPVYNPKPRYLQFAIQSALDQTAPSMEVLVGFDGEQPREIYEVVAQLQRANPNRLKSYQLDRDRQGGSISATTNYLADKASGHYLLLLDHDDWLRPDLLYRYEQSLRGLEHPDNIVLYCNEFKIDEHDTPIPGSSANKPDRPVFPYFFHNWICHCLLIPSKLWKSVGGLRAEFNGGQDFDLVLRLDLLGAQFHNVPFLLYGWRSHAESTAKNISSKPYAIESPLRSLPEYWKHKGLNWKVTHGEAPAVYRAIPPLHGIPRIHVIILSKGTSPTQLQACIDNVTNQRSVSVQISQIDLCENVQETRETGKSTGMEIISVPVSSNPSQVKNRIVRESSLGRDCDLVLFLSPQVSLWQGSLEEMSRWIIQPNIGIVGCRLYDTKGRIYHAGIAMNPSGTARSAWQHLQKGTPSFLMNWTRLQKVTDALSGACMVVSKDVFLETGGFDEVHYPDFYSDADFAIRLRNQGLYCFYTPYAEGIFRENTDCSLGQIQDVEGSYWLHSKANAARAVARRVHVHLPKE